MVKVWVVHRGYDAEVVALRGSKSGAESELRGLADDIAFADEYAMVLDEGKLTGRKLLSKRLKEEE